jgi:hypothetical protein
MIPPAARMKGWCVLVSPQSVLYGTWRTFVSFPLEISWPKTSNGSMPRSESNGEYHGVSSVIGVLAIARKLAKG